VGQGQGNAEEAALQDRVRLQRSELHGQADRGVAGERLPRDAAGGAIPVCGRTRARYAAPALDLLLALPVRQGPGRLLLWRHLAGRLGTLYLTIGAIAVAAPVGIITAVYLTQYAGESRFVSLIRTCIGTLAGVPSIVFGLFALAVFVNRFGMPKSALVAPSRWRCWCCRR